MLFAGSLLHGELAAAQARWARQAGGPGQDNARKLAIDGSGNAYVVGSFTGPAQFGAFTLGQAGAGGSQAYLAKYSAQGDVLWAKEAPAVVFADVAIDADGNACVLGAFSGSATFGSTKLTSQATGDVVIAKYDSQGQVLWARAGGTAPGSLLSASALAVDAAGNVYVAGSLRGSAFLGGSAGAITSEGPLNLFVAKYDGQGNPLWIRQGGGGTGLGCAGTGLGVDAAGNAYVAGFFGNTATFGTITLTNPTPATTGSISLLAKYSSSGAFEWVRDEGGPGAARIDGLAVDSQGNSFITGQLGGNPLRTNTFGPYVLKEDAFDGFLVKHDAKGNVLWANQIGGPSTEYGTGVAVDKVGNAYVTGIFGSPVATLGPTATLTSNGNKLVFAVKYNPQGKVLAAQREALCGFAYPAIAVGPNQDIYLTGQFSGTTSFASALLTGSANDVFITRLGDLSVPSTPDGFTCNGQAAPPAPAPGPAPAPPGNPAPLAELMIPNIITPNGDGQNDYFKINNLVDKEWALTVYNRWGKQVYNAPAYEQEWNAEGLASGIYYYALRRATGPQYTGWVQVVR
ncbi:hypothetical protein AXW84_22465 [Hymenobacter sp. PAMC 26628]|nr:hypothetical protein AXW84_22465 [Hymenobacter sp. PAMC 26628]